MQAAIILSGILGALLIGAISPGPSFVLVARTSIALSRRDGLAAALGMGLGSVALAWLLKEEGLFAAPEKPSLERPTYDTLPKTPQHAPQARAMISFFMQGGPSHVDLFDPKPELAKHSGETLLGLGHGPRSA